MYDFVFGLNLNKLVVLLGIVACVVLVAIPFLDAVHDALLRLRRKPKTPEPWTCSVCGTPEKRR